MKRFQSGYIMGGKWLHYGEKSLVEENLSGSKAGGTEQARRGQEL